MSKSIKAALLSGLIFPGIGHMLLKRYRRGVALMISTIAALSVIVAKAVNQALSILDRISSGEIPLEAGAAPDLALIVSSGTDDAMLNSAAIIVTVIWIFSIVDSYKLGKIP